MKGGRNIRRVCGKTERKETGIYVHTTQIRKTGGAVLLIIWMDLTTLSLYELVLVGGQETIKSMIYAMHV